jgi:hypothetical protein
MYFTPLIPLLLAAPSLASPLPTTGGSKRSCTIQFPDVAVTFSQLSPVSSDPGILMARTGGPGTNDIKAGITFNGIPAGATGCMLSFALPPVTSPNEFAVGANNFDVFGVSAPITTSTDWNNQPSTTTKWASMDVPEWVQTQPFQTVLMSDTCSPTMSFLLQLSDWQQQAGQVAIPVDGVTSGFWMTYNC